MATPEQEDQVRRALAAAARADDADGGGDRVPDHVAHRLDDVLSELVAQRSPRPETYDELAERRGRRWPQVLVAAVTIAVVVAAGGAVALRGMHGSSSDTASSRAAGSSAEQAAPSAPQSQDRLGSVVGGIAAAPELHRATLHRDVQLVVAGGLVTDRARAALPSAAPSPPAAKGAAPCTPRALPPGVEAVAVRLDGEPALLVLGPVSNRTRAARVYSCGDTRTPVATTRVRAR